jgi:hypothetical protein
MEKKNENKIKKTTNKRKMKEHLARSCAARQLNQKEVEY